jgi:hypothetical protein
MADLDDEQHEFTVAHLVDDPVVTDADAEPPMSACQRPGAMRARIRA